MAKTLGLDIIIGASIGGAIRGIKSVIGDIDTLGKTIEQLESKKITILDGIEKEFKSKLEPIESDLRKFFQKQRELRIKISKKDDELKELEAKLKETKKSIKALENEKIDLSKAFKKGKISAQEFENKTKEIEAQLGKLSKKELGLSQKMERAKKKASMLTGALGSVERKIEALKHSKLKLSAQLAEAKKEAIETNKELGKIGATMEKLRQSRARLHNLQIKRDQMRMRVVDTVAIGMTVAFPVKKAIEFESAMGDVRKVANLSEQETKAFGDQLLKLSTRLPVAADGLASIAASGAQLGIQKEKLVEFTELVAKMSTAFDMSADQAGKSIANLKNVYGLSMKEVEKLGDAINHLSDNTAAKAGDMVNVLARIGGVAKTFGLSAQGAAALADAFLAMGKTPETAATAINALLNKLQTADKQGKKFQEALRSMGLNAYELKMEIQADPQKAIMRVLKAIKGVSKEERMGVLTDMFGAEFADDIALLVGGLQNYQKALQLTAKESAYLGSMQNEFQNRSKSTANQLRLLQNSLTQIGIALGSVILPPLKTGAAYLSKFFNWVAELNEEFPLFGKAVSYTAVGLGTLAVTTAAVGYGATFLLSGFERAKIAALFLKNALSLANVQAKGLALWSGILSAKAKAAALMKGLWAAASTALSSSLTFLGGALSIATKGVVWLGRALLTNPLGLAIGAIAGAAYLLYRYWGPIKGFFGSLWDGIKSIFASALSGIKSVLSFSPIGLVFRAYKPVSEFFGNFWSSIGALFSKGASFIGSVFTSPVETIKKLFGQLFEWISKKFGAIGGIFKKAFSIGASIGSAIKGFFGGDEEEKPKPKIGEVVKKAAATTTVAASLAVAQPAVPDFAKMAHIQAPQTAQQVAQKPTQLGAAHAAKPQVVLPKPVAVEAVAPKPVAVRAVEPKPVAIQTVAPKPLPLSIAQPETIVPKLGTVPTIEPKLGKIPVIEPQVVLPKPVAVEAVAPKPVAIDAILPKSIAADLQSKGIEPKTEILDLFKEVRAVQPQERTAIQNQETKTKQSLEQTINVTINFGDIVVQDGESVKEKIKEQIQSAIDEIDFNRFQGDLYDVV